MVTMRVSASAFAVEVEVEVEVEDALARVERARRAACARNEATSRRVDASARARGAALACAERAALIADIARVVRASLPSRCGGAVCGRGASGSARRRRDCSRFGRLDNLSRRVAGRFGARDGRSRERAIVARSSGTRAG
jgi:hypothetical protein